MLNHIQLLSFHNNLQNIFETLPLFECISHKYIAHKYNIWDHIFIFFITCL